MQAAGSYGYQEKLFARDESVAEILLPKKVDGRDGYSHVDLAILVKIRCGYD